MSGPKRDEEKGAGGLPAPASASAPPSPTAGTAEETNDVGYVNASGHFQEPRRGFGLVSAASVAVVTGNSWVALGGSIAVAVINGGPPGITYEFIAVAVPCWLIAACIAELASSVPSSAGVYHWASLTAGPKYGNMAGWFAGWWNFFAWVIGSASWTLILATQVLAMWGLFHPEYVVQRWHTLVLYLVFCWTTNVVVLFANKALPKMQQVGLLFILGGWFATILVYVIVPSNEGGGHASNEFVWKDWVNSVGYDSDAFVFLLGMLNGAYALGTPDFVSHLAEEIPNPHSNVPKVIGIQTATNFITGVCYIVALLYSIQDLDAALALPYAHPPAEAYRQATGSRGGALGLMVVIFLPALIAGSDIFITSGRMLWTLARDDATPFSGYLGRASDRWQNPFNATLGCGIICTLLGFIYVGSATAFNAFVGSFVVLSTLSYVAAILPHILTGRKHMKPGPFYMPCAVALPVYCLASAYILAFVVIFCFPYALPTTAETMNYSSLITGGLTMFMSAWWLWKRNRGYRGPLALMVVEGRSSAA